MSSSEKLNGKRVGLKVVGLVLTLGLLYLFRPLFHGIIYTMLFSPGGFYVMGLTVLSSFILFLYPPLSEDTAESVAKKSYILGSIFIIGIVLALTLGTLGSMFENDKLASETTQESTEVSELPEANAQNPRIIPRAVADVQTRGSVSYRQHKLGTSDIARTPSGKLAWSYSIKPDQLQNQLRGNQRGILLSDMTRVENRSIDAYDEQEFKYGQSMFLQRSAGWNLKKTDYWAQYIDEPSEFVHNGTSYMAYPKTGHKWNLLPVPHTTPTWEGVALVHPDGNIEHMSPEEARKSEILEGQRLYPLYNSRVKAESLRYRNGIVNQLPLIGTFEGVVIPAEMPRDAGNEQPFVIDLEEEKMTYIYTMEPAGADTRGLDEVWFFNSRTGEPQFYGTGGDTLLGPERAMGLIRSEDSQTNWGSNFKVVEPIPTVIKGDLWWHAKVVPTDNTDISRNAFVNARTGDVVELDDTESVVQFMSGKDIEEVDDGNVTTEPSNAEDVEYYIVIRDESGNVVDRIPVLQAQKFDIETSNTADSNNTTG